MQATDTRAASPADAAPGTRVRLPLLGALLDKTDTRDRCVWLDLGPVREGLVRRLNHRRTRLLVADLPQARTDGRKDWYRPQALLAEPFWNEHLGIVLAWDLLNYADADQLTRLSAQLAEHTAEGSQLHALIRYSVPNMPDRPCDCRLIQGNELEFTEPEGPATPGPRHSPRALEKAMPDFRVDQTVLLNNGMQEFLLTRR